MAATVVVIDDDEDIREAVTDALELEGYRVVASDGSDALKALHAAEPPCVALLDLVMPRIDGLALRRSIAADARLSSVPIIACTAQRTSELSTDGFAAVLHKPFSEAQLLDVLARALGQTR